MTWGFISRRIVQALLTLLVLLSAIFFLSRATGDPTYMLVLPETPQAEIDRIRGELGLAEPLHVQYLRYIANVAKGDLGYSLFTREPAMRLVASRLPNSFLLAVSALCFAVILGLPLAVVAAVKRGTSSDHSIRLLASMGLTLPNFLVAFLLIEVFSVTLGLLPSAGMGDVRNLILPGFTMGIFVLAGIVRLLRSSMLDVLDAEFVLLARIKGLSENRIIWKHALRNSFLATFTFAGTMITQIVTAAVVVETVFAWPGLGRLIYEAVMRRDFPVVQAGVFTAAALVLATNLVVDVIYAYLDPRIRQR